MKRSFLFLSVITVMLAGCNCDDNCGEQNPMNCDLVDLSDEYIPVCGCDDVTYQNAGHAECIGRISEYTEWECD
jgi:hypothetical protein